jgi:hypothetical protein
LKPYFKKRKTPFQKFSGHGFLGNGREFVRAQHTTPVLCGRMRIDETTTRTK